MRRVSGIHPVDNSGNTVDNLSKLWKTCHNSKYFINFRPQIWGTLVGINLTK